MEFNENLMATSAVIIGAGIGGIATAIHLARQGMQVTVVEKNARPGGRCDHLVRDGHHFDTGPTLLVMPLVYEAEFKALGVSLHDVLELQRVDPTYHLVFDDNSQLALTSDMSVMREQLEAIETGSFDGFLRYLDEGCRHYSLAMDRLVNKDFRSATSFFNPDNLSLLFALKPLEHHYPHMSIYFDEPRLKAAFTFQDMYMGLSPFEAPATFSMMPYTELAHGVWYPKGGMYRIVEALMNIAHCAGVHFQFETAVTEINVSGDRVCGITLEGDRLLSADLVIANADLPYVYHDLLPHDNQTEQLENKRYSCSVISFFWGVDKVYDQLGPHTLYLVDDYKGNFDDIENLKFPRHPSMYLHAPARLDPSMAPLNEDTLIAIVPVQHMSDDTDQDWKQIRESARQAVFTRLARAGITDLEAHIKIEMNYVPPSWQQRYNLVKGATHGLSHTLTQLGYLRPHNRHDKYHNLYFVGASTHPGTGVPTALIAARLVAERIKDEINC
jgi:phytoene desaturase